MAIKRVIDLEVNSGQAKTSIEDVKQYLSGTEQSATSLRKQLREATMEVALMADKFGDTSREAVEAAKKAAILRDRIGDAKNLTDAFNPDAKFKAFTSSLSGVASGFAAVQGGMSLLGLQSEKTVEVLLKVQSAMALSQGLQGIGEARDSFKQLGAVIKNAGVLQKVYAGATLLASTAQKAFGFAVNTTSTSFKVLRGAIISTGIGALVVALGFAVNALVNFAGASDRAKIAQEGLNKELERQNKLLNTAAEGIKIATQSRKNEAILAGKSQKEIEQIQKEGNQATLAILENDITQKTKIRIEAQKNKVKEIKGFLEEENKAISELEKERNRQALEEQEQRVEAYKTEQDKLKTAREKAAADAEKQRLLAEKLEEERRARETKRVEELKNELKVVTDAIAEDEYRNLTIQEEAHIQRLVNLGANQQEIISVQDYYTRLRAEIDAKNKEDEYEAELEAEDRILALRKQKADEEIEIEKQVAEAKKAIQDGTFVNISNGIGLLRTVFEKNKGMQKALLVAESLMGIAKTIISTKAANAAITLKYAALPGGELLAARAIAINNIGAAIGIGANIAATAKALKSIGGGSVSSPQVGNDSGGGGGSANSTPQFNVVGNSAVNQIATTIGQQQPIQAYVVANQVTTQQALDRNIINNASLG